MWCNCRSLFYWGTFNRITVHLYCNFNFILTTAELHFISNSSEIDYPVRFVDDVIYDVSGLSLYSRYLSREKLIYFFVAISPKVINWILITLNWIFFVFWLHDFSILGIPLELERTASGLVSKTSSRLEVFFWKSCSEYSANLQENTDAEVLFQ